MRFISLILLALLLAACASSPEKAAKQKKVDAQAVTDTTAASSILPAGPATPNPYLADIPSVNRATQQTFNDAVTAMQQEDWNQAERLLLRLTKDQPKLSGAHLNLGLVYRALNKRAQAEESFQKAIASNSKNLDAYNQLAILKREAGDFAEAEDLYQQALAVWPYHPESHKNIAILYDLYLGKTQQALAHYRAYAELTGDSDKQLPGWIADLERRVAAQGGN